MTYLWGVPVVVLAVGAFFVLVATGRLLDEARRLGASLQEWKALQPQVVRVRTDAEELRQVIARRHRA